MHKRCDCCRRKLPTKGMKGIDCDGCYTVGNPDDINDRIRCLCIKCSDQGMICLRCQRFALKMFKV